MSTSVLELKPLKDYNLSHSEQGKYIPILDRNPEKAARSLVIKDLKKTYLLLKETFAEIKEGKIYHEVLANTIVFSYYNFGWFASFLKELENILRVRKKVELPYEKCPTMYEVTTKTLIAYQPFYVTLVNGKVLFHNYRVLSKKLHFINNYRIKYIMEDYDMSDFIDDCYPEWYLLQNTTIFEQYSEKTNVRVRVDFRDREFVYYVAGASDNWKRIENVPVEMDDVVAALIFRSYSNP